jgi:uncharacterized protein
VQSAAFEMLRKKLRFRWFAGAVVMAALELAGVAAVGYALTSQAQAQYRSRSGGGFFQDLFGPFNGGGGGQQVEQQPQVDFSRAPPPPRKDKTDTTVPTTSIVVMGDGMADWLGYGLEDAFSDSPEVAIVRKSHARSGLLRYDAKGDLDWWHVARDALAQEKADYVVMMLGVGDRQNIREKDLSKEKDKEADKKKTANNDQSKDEPEKNADNKDQADDPDLIIAPEPQGKKANGMIEFRTDPWAEIYTKRIDDTIAALKSKGVPVFWVGLPALRGPRATADAVYLNDLYRARAEKAGVIYIDVWDGFVDEGGKFTTQGPDYEGQIRRLRSGDGIYFTKAGALKLAHYVEREIHRVMANRATPVALPSGVLPGLQSDVKSTPTARPLAGPVMPLTVTSGNTDELLGGSISRPSHSDPIATQVLVKGETVPAPIGRADDFAWPRGSDAKAVAPAATPSAATVRAEPADTAPAKPGQKKSGPSGKSSQSADEKTVKPAHRSAPRPPRPVVPSGGPFGWLR